MDTQGFPPRLDLFKAMAVQQADEDDNPSIPELGKNWLRSFLNSLLHQLRQATGEPKLIISYFQKLEIALRKHKSKLRNMYKMDETGFLLGISDHGKVTVRRSRRRNAEEMTG